MLYRLACPADAEALVRLNAAFNEVDDVSATDIRRSLAESAEIVVVAEINGTAVAFCCAQVHRSFCYKTPVAEVTEMYVDAAYRRKGYASGMLTFLEEHMRTTCGVDELHLLTGADNHAAQAAYQKAGFVKKNEAYMMKEVPRNR